MRTTNEEKREINCFICTDGRGLAQYAAARRGRRHLISSPIRDTQTFTRLILAGRTLPLFCILDVGNGFLNFWRFTVQLSVSNVNVSLFI